MDMPFLDLDLELWLIVFQHLRQPLPSPITRRRPDSSLIRQPGLVACMLVNKTWHDLAGSVLYSVVVTDSLLHLVLDVSSPAIPGILSKRDLLRLTQRLFVEYQYSDDELLERSDPHEGRRDSYEGDVDGATPTGAEHHNHGQRGVGEAERLETAIMIILNTKPGDRLLFGRLRTLSVGAFGGSHDDLRWRDAGSLGTWSALRDRLANTWSYFIDRHVLTLQHYCASGLGPLSREPKDAYQSAPQHPIGGPTSAFHYHKGWSHFAPISPGPGIRRYVHGGPRGGGLAYPHSVIDHALQTRLRYSSMPVYSDPSLDWHLSAEIYLDLPPAGAQGEYLHSKTEDEKEDWRAEAQAEQELLDKLGEVGRQDLPEWCKPEDKWVVKQLFDAPACGACDWRPDTYPDLQVATGW